MTEVDEAIAALTEFYRARLDETERTARTQQDSNEPDDGARPQRTLRRIEGLRMFLADYDALKRKQELIPNPPTQVNRNAMGALLDIFRRLALEFADHPDYREEWRP